MTGHMETKNISRVRSQPEGDVVVGLALHRDGEQEHVVVADFLSLAIRKMWIAPVTALGAALVAWFLSSLVTPVYESSAIFQLGTIFVYQRGTVTVEPVDQVYKRIGFKSSTAVNSDDGRMFIVRVREATPELARESARRVVEATLAKHAPLFEGIRAANQQAVGDLHSLLRTDTRDFGVREKAIESLHRLETATALMEPTTVVIPPNLPSEPVRPHTGRNITLGFIVGLVIGLLVSYLSGYVKYVMMRGNVRPFPRL